MCDMTHSNVWHDAFKYVSCAVSRIRLVYCLFFHLHVTFGTCTSLLALCKTLVVSAKPLSYTVLRQPSFSSHKYAFFLNMPFSSSLYLINRSVSSRMHLFAYKHVFFLMYESLFSCMIVSFVVCKSRFSHTCLFWIWAGASQICLFSHKYVFFLMHESLFWCVRLFSRIYVSFGFGLEQKRAPVLATTMCLHTGWQRAHSLIEWAICNDK